MSTTTQTKTVSNLTAATAIADSNNFLIHDGNGLKKITHANLIDSLVADGAGAHNAVYRGKNLGTEPTAKQYAEISSGRFRGLYIGDYWTKNGKNWRIASFDYFYQTGDTALTRHHIVVVPDGDLGTGPMNDENTTQGGYSGSKARTEGILVTATLTVEAAFGDHVLQYRDILINAVNASGLPTGHVCEDCKVELMTEEMVYGGPEYGIRNAGTPPVPVSYKIGKSQFPLFAFDTLRMNNSRSPFWLRDTISGTSFACVNSYGGTNYNSASNSGVRCRPCFLLS